MGQSAPSMTNMMGQGGPTMGQNAPMGNFQSMGQYAPTMGQYAPTMGQNAPMVAMGQSGMGMGQSGMGDIASAYSVQSIPHSMQSFITPSFGNASPNLDAMVNLNSSQGVSLSPSPTPGSKAPNARSSLDDIQFGNASNSGNPFAPQQSWN